MALPPRQVLSHGAVRSRDGTGEPGGSGGQLRSLDGSRHNISPADDPGSPQLGPRAAAEAREHRPLRGPRRLGHPNAPGIKGLCGPSALGGVYPPGRLPAPEGPV